MSECKREEEPVLVSAITHYGYCPRRCALVCVERTFEDNVYTLRGVMAHEHVDEPETDLHSDVRVERALPIWSERYRLQGRTDVVEFRPDGSVYPVEYKIGSRKPAENDDMQLCAQALCLEEMLDCEIKAGAIFSGASRRRREVEFTQKLREQTVAVICAIQEILHTDRLPAPVNDVRCPNCSLLQACMPSVISETEEPDIYAPTHMEAPA